MRVFDHVSGQHVQVELPANVAPGTTIHVAVPASSEDPQVGAALPLSTQLDYHTDVPLKHFWSALLDTLGGDVGARQDLLDAFPPLDSDSRFKRVRGLLLVSHTAHGHVQHESLNVVPMGKIDDTQLRCLFVAGLLFVQFGVKATA